jgi:hypothetical protein
MPSTKHSCLAPMLNDRKASLSRYKNKCQW